MRTHRIAGREQVSEIRQSADYDVVPAVEAAAVIARLAATAGGGPWQAAAATLAKHFVDLRSPPGPIGFMLLRAPMSYAERITPPEDVITPAKLKRLRDEHESNHNVSFEFITDTGHLIEDEAGYELIFPDGKFETGKLASSKAERSGVKPGIYELRTRSIRGASWLLPSVQPFERVGLSVSTKGFPDGTVVKIAIRYSWAALNSPPLAQLEAKVLADSAESSWMFEQALGDSPYQDLIFDAIVGQKRSWSGLLIVNPAAADTTRGAQDRLRALGYDVGPPSDEITDAFNSALELFQSHHPPLVVSGFLDGYTINVLDDLAP